MLKKIARARLLAFDFGDYRFSAGIIPTIVVAVLLYVMLHMAQWQAGKAEYKENLKTTIEQRRDLTPAGIDELPNTLEERRFLPVVVYGRFDEGHQFLLDNKIMNGRAGFDVYTPFIMDNGVAILVNRGWLPQGRTRADLPDLSVTDSKVSFEGLLDYEPSRTVLLADDVHAEVSWPMVLQYVDTEELTGMLGYPLMSMILRMDADAPFGYARELPALQLDSAKNTGYAFQWYAMSVALVVIYLAVNTRRKQRDPEPFQ